MSAPTLSASELQLAEQDRGSLGKSARQIAASSQAVLFVIVAGLWLYLSNASDVFWTERNIGTLLSSISLITITAIGMTLLLIAREVDLSVGSMQAFVGVMAMQELNRHESLLLGILFALIVGAMIGLINAGLTLGMGINSFVVTLGMLSILRGAAYTATNAAVQNDHKLPSFKRVFNGAMIDDPVRIPWPVAVMAVVFVIFSLLLSRTTFGRHVYAVGGNPRAAALSGIPVNLIKTICFVATSMLAALSAFMLIARMNSGQNNAGFGFELQVIGAVLLGGASLAGGKGTLAGTLFAALLLGTLNNGITLLGYNPNWQTALPGIVIVLAVFFDSVRRRATQEA